MELQKLHPEYFQNLGHPCLPGVRPGDIPEGAPDPVEAIIQGYGLVGLVQLSRELHRIAEVLSQERDPVPSSQVGSPKEISVADPQKALNRRRIAPGSSGVFVVDSRCGIDSDSESLSGSAHAVLGVLPISEETIV